MDANNMKGARKQMARPVGARVQTVGNTTAPVIVRRAMKLRGYTLKMLADDLGYSGPKSVWGMLNVKNNMQVNVLLAILDDLGFDLIVKDKNGANRENVWKIEKASLEDLIGHAPEDGGE